MITTLGLNQARDLLIGAATGGIARLEIGDGTSTAALSDTALTGANTFGKSASIWVKGDTTTQFSMSVLVGEGNGTGSVDYSEMGALVTTSGTLVSRHNFRAKTKDATVAFRVQLVLDVI